LKHHASVLSPTFRSASGKWADPKRYQDTEESTHGICIARLYTWYDMIWNVMYDNTKQVYPPDSLDDGDRQRIRMLAMPDCNTTQIGDCFYCFRWCIHSHSHSWHVFCATSHRKADHKIKICGGSLRCTPDQQMLSAGFSINRWMAWCLVSDDVPAVSSLLIIPSLQGNSKFVFDGSHPWVPVYCIYLENRNKPQVLPFRDVIGQTHSRHHRLVSSFTGSTW